MKVFFYSGFVIDIHGKKQEVNDATQSIQVRLCSHQCNPSQPNDI
ncbi:hypothetical protein M595_0875 [Lyngbya aestuarii BL J]|uniref:Uncharacterized protein n=1 Tax=Lyngbya aestuarii BL J TaxID=1348334 RepID=U7QMK1_9CYAN|nr:hypothetical protein M595_0875 [Lyngbya aestuarii BL J]